MEKKQYTKCKHFLLFDCFKNKKSQLTKCCIKCLDYCKKSRQKTKCIHRRQRSKCKDCCGGHICEHGRQRSQCKDCGGSRICEHNKTKSRCQDCGGCEICGHNKIKSQDAKIVVGVEFVNKQDEDQVAPHAIPLDTLLWSY